MHEEYGLDPEKLPAYKFFKKETQEVIDYKGAKTAKKKILSFIEEHANIYTTAKPGTVPKLDEVAKEWMEADSDGRAALQTRVEKLVAGLKAGSTEAADAAQYIKVMEKIEAKGSGWPAEEIGRIEKLLGGSLSEKKKDELRAR